MGMLQQDQRLLEVNTPLGANTLVIHQLTGSEFISKPFRFNLDLLAQESTQVDQKSLLGKAVLVTMRHEDAKRYFHGIVSKITSGSQDEHFRHYHVEVAPWLWLLTLKTSSRIFQDKTVIQIIEAVFDDLKKSFPEVNYRDATSGNHIPLDYCVQYRETDFNFVSRMMEQEGIFYFFEHTADKHTLVFADAATAIAKCPGQSQVLYREGGIGERDGIITYWQQDWAELPGKYSMRDHHFQLPSKSLEVRDQARDTTVSSLEFYDYPGEFVARFNKPEQRLGKVEQEGDNHIRVRMEQELLNEVSSIGHSTRPNLVAGFKFSLTKHFSCNGDYILTEVHHSVAQSPDYISQMAPANPYQNKFTCLPAATHLRPQRVNRKPVVSGPQTAVVAVKSGEESWLDKFGRVRVQFFWDREGKDNDTSACWVRVAQKWAGAGWGAHFWPRIGQEVVVEFLEGDPDRPLITGSVYNPDSMPPYTLPDNYTRSGIVTESSKYSSSTNFNEIRFEDKMGQEQIFINAERDMDWRVENDERRFVGDMQDQIVKVDQRESIEAAKQEHVKGEHKEKVEGNASREIGGDHKEQIAGKLSLQVSGAAHEKVGSVYVLEAVNEIHLKSSQNVVIEGMRISFKSPGGFVDVGPSGVAIQGIKVNINSGGSAASGTAASPDTPDTPKDAQVAEDVTARVKMSAGFSAPSSSQIGMATSSQGSGTSPSGSSPMPAPPQHLSYQPTSGASLTAEPGKTTTILGRYNPDMKEIVNELGNQKSLDFGPKSGGFNVLNVPDNLYNTPDQFWQEYNQPWLDQAIKRGDNIVLATEPTAGKLTDSTGALTGFGREYNYLLSKGYIYDSTTKTMLKS